MAVQGENLKIAIAAGADLSSGVQFKAVAVAGTVAATNATTLGILENRPKSGEGASLAYFGHTKAYVGAAVTAGALLKVTTSGYLTNVASGDGAVAKAITAAGSGSICEVLVNFANTANTY